MASILCTGQGIGPHTPPGCGRQVFQLSPFITSIDPTARVPSKAAQILAAACSLTHFSNPHQLTTSPKWKVSLLLSCAAMCCPRTPQLPTRPCPHRHLRRRTSIEHPLTTFRVYRGGRSSRHRQWVRITTVRAFRRRCLWDYTSCAIGPPTIPSHSCVQHHGAPDSKLQDSPS